MKWRILSFAVFIFTMLVHAQGDIETSFESADGKVVISYILRADADKEYDVSVILKRSGDASYSYVPESLSGDIGRGKFAIGKRSITWSLKGREMSLFDGNDFYFEVTALPVEVKSGSTWYYYVGGVLLGGGAAAAVVLNKKSDNSSSSSSTTFPVPPGRPK